MNNLEERLIQQTVVMTLQLLGLHGGYVSYNKAQKLWGKPFRKAVSDGKIRPVCVGEGANGTKTYSVIEIIKVMI